MSGLVNKVKEALHSAHDTPSDERTGKLNLTQEERERLEAAGYGSEHHAEKRHLGATEDITQVAGGHPPSHYLDKESTATANLPGAFPDSQQESIGSHHQDGREYVAPKGTQVGSTQTAHQPAYDPNVGNAAGASTASKVTENPLHAGDNTRTTDTTIASTGTAAGAGAAGVAAYETKTGPNKLHKREDPRGHVAFNDPPSHEAIHGTQSVSKASDIGSKSTTTGTDTTTATHHSLAGTHHTPATEQQEDLYEQQASRKYDGNNDTNSPSTPNYSYPTGSTVAAGAVGVGGLAAYQSSERKIQDDKGVTGSQNITGYDHGSLTGTSTSQSPPRGVGVYNTVTGAGSQDDPTQTHHSSGLVGSASDQTGFQPHPGLTSGSQAIPREAGDPTVTSGYGNTTGSSYAPLPSTLTSGGLTSSQGNTSTSTTNPGATYTIGTAAPHGASTTSNSANEHYGPGHLGSKVVHTCTTCGEDNDITHYFKKETVYRLSQ